MLAAMGLKRTRGAVYDLKYHLVWVPKYRRMVLRGRVAQRLREIFEGIAARYEFDIDTQEVVEDHVQVIVQIHDFTPRPVATSRSCSA